jgi:hypothetical protein
MPEEAKPKRKYQRRKARVEPLAVYSVMVTVARGRKTETIYAESTRVENGCLVIVSMDGPPPLVEKVRYIPLGGAEITVCARPQRQAYPPYPQSLAPSYELPMGGYVVPTSGPKVSPGPLEIARQREAMAPVARPRQMAPMVERNADGVAVVTAGFGDERPI